MKVRIALSLLLMTACLIAYGQGKKSDKAGKHGGAAAEKGLIKVSVMYPFAEGKKFDMDYYQNSHMPMVAGFLGANLVKYTIEKGLASGIPNQPLPYAAIGIFYVKSLEEYQSAMAPNRDAIRADIPKYTDIAPIILVS